MLFSPKVKSQHDPISSADLETQSSLCLHFTFSCSPLPVVLSRAHPCSGPSVCLLGHRWWLNESLNWPWPQVAPSSSLISSPWGPFGSSDSGYLRAGWCPASSLSACFCNLAQNIALDHMGTLLNTSKSPASNSAQEPLTSQGYLAMFRVLLFC